MVDHQHESTIMQMSSFVVCTVPGPVENLRVAVNPNVPSVTLAWCKPQNVGPQCSWSRVDNYHIRCKPQGREHYDEVNMRVGWNRTRVVLKRDSGLVPHTTTIFEVKAQCENALGEWTAVSVFIGERTVFNI